uniref:Uncharacterized protein n=1 Tax=Timema tahoe TaxID=61484 RepID=A0A7R9FMG0_9NEOP|nr:unnamed protein product [Timema tahoe]
MELTHASVDHVLPSDDQYSFLHVKAFGLHNHLSADPWSTEYIYFIDKKWKIQRYIHSQTPSRVEELSEVWELPSHHERRPGHYNPSMSFSSPELVVLTDGAGTLHLVNTGPRAGTAAWEVLFSEEVCGKETPFTILHSRTVDHEEVHCLLLHIDDRSAAGDSKETGPVFLNMVEWVTLVQGDSSTWSVRSVRRLCGPGNLDYTALEDTCSSVYIASDKPFHYTMDSENTINEDKTEPLPITVVSMSMESKAHRSSLFPKISFVLLLLCALRFTEISELFTLQDVSESVSKGWQPVVLSRSAPQDGGVINPKPVCEADKAGLQKETEFKHQYTRQTPLKPYITPLHRTAIQWEHLVWDLAEIPMQDSSEDEYTQSPPQHPRSHRPKQDSNLNIPVIGSPSFDDLNIPVINSPPFDDLNGPVIGSPSFDDLNIPVIDSPPFDDLNGPVIGSPSFDDLNIPVIDSSPFDELNIPVIDSPPFDDLNIPVIDSSPFDELNIPVIDSPPFDDLNIPVIDSSPFDELNIPVIDSPPFDDLNIPVIDSPPFDDLNGPVIDSPPFDDLNIPVIDSPPLSTEGVCGNNLEPQTSIATPAKTDASLQFQTTQPVWEGMAYEPWQKQGLQYVWVRHKFLQADETARLAIPLALKAKASELPPGRD